MRESARDLTRTTLAVLVIFALLASAFIILRPFLAAAVWATMIVVATWPLMLAAQARLWRKRWLAVAAMTAALLLVFLLPLALGIGTIVSHLDEIRDGARLLADLRVPPPPDWVAALPLAGERLAAAWREVAADGGKGVLAWIAPHAGTVLKWFGAQLGGLGVILVQFLLTVVIAAILYAAGEQAGRNASRFGRRLAGERGEEAVRLAAQAIRGVALGVVLTALAQSVLGGIGLAVAGIPAAPLLTAVMFMLCLAQLGPLLVLAPAVIWLYWSGDALWGTLLLAWTALVASLDNFLRPVLIRQSADLPLLLIFAGVIGGLISLGVVGIFVGPVVLAVAYTLFEAWISEAPAGRRETGES